MDSSPRNPSTVVPNGEKGEFIGPLFILKKLLLIIAHSQLTDVFHRGPSSQHVSVKFRVLIISTVTVSGWTSFRPHHERTVFSWSGLRRWTYFRHFLVFEITHNHPTWFISSSLDFFYCLDMFDGHLLGSNDSQVKEKSTMKTILANLLPGNSYNPIPFPL